MTIYDSLREFADSWGLLAMALFFAGVVLRLFRPGAAAQHDDAADIPFRNDTIPGDAGEHDGGRG